MWQGYLHHEVGGEGFLGDEYVASSSYGFKDGRGATGNGPCAMEPPTKKRKLSPEPLEDPPSAPSFAWRRLSGDELRADGCTFLDGNQRPLGNVSLVTLLDKGLEYCTEDGLWLNYRRNHIHISCTVDFQDGRSVEFVQTPEGVFPVTSLAISVRGVESVRRTPVPMYMTNAERHDQDEPPLVSVQLRQRVRLTRLHFRRATANNARKNGVMNPNQEYFRLVVALIPVTPMSPREVPPVAACVSDPFIVRGGSPGVYTASNPAVASHSPSPEGGPQPDSAMPAAPASYATRYPEPSGPMHAASVVAPYMNGTPMGSYTHMDIPAAAHFVSQTPPSSISRTGPAPLAAPLSSSYPPGASSFINSLLDAQGMSHMVSSGLGLTDSGSGNGGMLTNTHVGMSASGMGGDFVGKTVFHGTVGINTSDPQSALHVNGDIRVTGAILRPSDRRIKHNIRPADTAEQLENIKKVQLYDYEVTPEWMEVSGRTRAGERGVIAQEVQEILPDAVVQVPSVAAGEGREIFDFLAVDQNRLFLENVGATKEVAKKMDGLDERVAGLEKNEEAGVSKTRKSNRCFIIGLVVCGILLVSLAVLLAVFLTRHRGPAADFPVIDPAVGPDCGPTGEGWRQPTIQLPAVQTVKYTTTSPVTIGGIQAASTFTIRLAPPSLYHSTPGACDVEAQVQVEDPNNPGTFSEYTAPIATFTSGVPVALVAPFLTILNGTIGIVNVLGLTNNAYYNTTDGILSSYSGPLQQWGGRSQRVRCSHDDHGENGNHWGWPSGCMSPEVPPNTVSPTPSASSAPTQIILTRLY